MELQGRAVRARRAIAVAALVAAALVAGCSSGGESEAIAGGGDVPQNVPEGFPIPAGAEVVHDGSAASLRVEGRSVDEVTAFYREDLAAEGWTIVDDFDGVDPLGATTTGFVVQRGDDEGVVAFSEADGDVLLRINFLHPSPAPSSAPTSG